MSKKALNWVGNAVFAILLAAMVVLVFFSISSKVSKDGIPGLGSYKLMVVLSGSMSPEFEAGDVIVVSENKEQNQYKKGDVITYKDPEEASKIVTHRVIEVIKNGDSTSYKTQGDANNSPDIKPIPSDNVIGQQKWHIPYFGKVVEFAKTKQGLVALIIVPGVLIILNELRNMAKAVTEEIERKKREAVAQPWSKESRE